MEPNPSFSDKLNHWAKNSVTLKLVAIGFLILILMIPKSMIESLVYQRQTLRDEATVEVSSKWGSAQTIGGPVISIPYYSTYKDDKGISQTQISYAHFLPENIQVTGSISTEKRYRGIYVVVLYNTQLHVQGNFSKLSFEGLNVGRENLILKDAVLNFGITDMKGIKNKIQFKVGDKTTDANPGTISQDIFASGVNVPVDLSSDEGFAFSTDLNLNGSSEVNFLPFGKETNVKLTSTWDNPSFQGSFLPDNRSVNSKGFSADWKVLQLNRNFPQQGVGAFISDNASFGVRFLLPVDEYKKTTRSIEYGIMFIVITFLAFFFIEILNKKRIHSIQYLLVGSAIVLFYVLLLSISEHLSFNLSYLIGSSSILLLITLYAFSVFKSIQLTAIFSGILALLYGFFYSLLQLQDYSLLLGSIGLLIILAVVMYLTRNIDWYNWNKD